MSCWRDVDVGDFAKQSKWNPSLLRRLLLYCRSSQGSDSRRGLAVGDLFQPLSSIHPPPTADSASTSALRLRHSVEVLFSLTYRVRRSLHSCNSFPHPLSSHSLSLSVFPVCFRLPRSTSILSGSSTVPSGAIFAVQMTKTTLTAGSERLERPSRPLLQSPQPASSQRTEQSAAVSQAARGAVRGSTSARRAPVRRYRVAVRRCRVVRCELCTGATACCVSPSRPIRCCQCGPSRLSLSRSRSTSARNGEPARQLQPR